MFFVITVHLVVHVIVKHKYVKAVKIFILIINVYNNVHQAIIKHFHFLIKKKHVLNVIVVQLKHFAMIQLINVTLVMLLAFLVVEMHKNVQYLAHLVNSGLTFSV